MKTFSIFCSLIIALATVAIAQPADSPKPQRKVAPAAPANSANEMTGTLVEFVAGQSIVINTGTQNERFKLSAQAQYFNPKGRQVPERKLKKDRKVRVHYAKQGDDRVVDRVTIVRGAGKKQGKRQQSGQ